LHDQSQFIEMFGGKKYDDVPAKTVLRSLRNGVSPSKHGSHSEKVLTLSAITQGTFDPEAWKNGEFDECPPEDKRIKQNELYICRGNGNKTLVGTAVYSKMPHSDLVFPDTVIAATVDESLIQMPYLCAAWRMSSVREQIEEQARTTNGTYKINQSIIENIMITLPPLAMQEEFVTFLEQSDKSKFAGANRNLSRCSGIL